jgi:transcriptional regulator with XRE-family HTH domain
MYQLIALRKKKKLSQKELANKVGVTRARLSQWEIKENLYPHRDILLKLCDVLDCTLDDLLR